MAKAIEYHLDLFDKEIRKGSFVVTNWYNSDLQVCVVTKLSPKMVRIERLNTPKSSYRPYKNKYPKEMMVVEGDDVTMYVLKNAGKHDDF